MKDVSAFFALPEKLGDLIYRKIKYGPPKTNRSGDIFTIDPTPDRSSTYLKKVSNF